jgi:hypothetical protein
MVNCPLWTLQHILGVCYGAGGKVLSPPKYRKTPADYKKTTGGYSRHSGRQSKNVLSLITHWRRFIAPALMDGLDTDARMIWEALL